jgi:hypothetical protein
MNEMTFAIFALLPLGLASFVHRTRAACAGFGFLAALAPVIAKGAMNLIGGKQKQAAAKQQAAYEQQMAAQQEEQRRSAFEAAQDAPGKAMERMGFNMKLGRILGAMGGRGKVPPSLLKQYDLARQRASYTPGAAYIPKPTGGSKWDFASGLADAMSYLNIGGDKDEESGGSGGGVLSALRRPQGMTGNIVPTMTPVAKPPMIPLGGVDRKLPLQF